MMNGWTRVRSVGLALALFAQREIVVAQATNCQLPSVEEQLAKPIHAIVQDGGADSFIIITLTDSAPDCTIANGTYRGWQFQYTGPTPATGGLAPVLYSSHATLPNGALKADWAAVNYLLNHQNGTPREVQRALWILLGGRIPVAADQHFPVTPAVAAMVVSAVTEGHGFVPAPGQVSAVLLAAGQPARWLLVETVLPSSSPRAATIADMLWDDLNGDSAWQAGEPLLGATEVWLTDGAGRFVAGGLTEPDGFFYLDFQTVLPGEFRLYLPAHTNFTRPCAAVGAFTSAGFTESFGIGADGMIFMLPKALASVGDIVWADLNQNGSQDEGEPGISGVGVTLLRNGVVVAQTNCDASGRYRFNGLPSGRYSIRVQSPSGFCVSPRNAGTSAEHDSNLDPETGRIDCELAAGREELSLDIGLVPICTLSGQTWQDSNRNARLDAADRGLAGVGVTLLTSDGIAVAQTATDANGVYRFERLRPGNYRVQFSAVPGFDRINVSLPRGQTSRAYVSLSGPQKTGVDAVWRKRAASPVQQAGSRIALRPLAR